MKQELRHMVFNDVEEVAEQANKAYEGFIHNIKKYTVTDPQGDDQDISQEFLSTLP